MGAGLDVFGVDSDTFSAARPPAPIAPRLYIGPSQDGRQLEVMVEIDGTTVKVFHVMELREKFRRYANSKGAHL